MLVAADSSSEESLSVHARTIDRYKREMWPIFFFFKLSLFSFQLGVEHFMRAVLLRPVLSCVQGTTKKTSKCRVGLVAIPHPCAPEERKRFFYHHIKLLANPFYHLSSARSFAWALINLSFNSVAASGRCTVLRSKHLSMNLRRRLLHFS